MLASWQGDTGFEAQVKFARFIKYCVQLANSSATWCMGRKLEVGVFQMRH